MLYDVEFDARRLPTCFENRVIVRPNIYISFIIQNRLLPRYELANFLQSNDKKTACRFIRSVKCKQASKQSFLLENSVIPFYNIAINLGLYIKDDIIIDVGAKKNFRKGWLFFFFLNKHTFIFYWPTLAARFALSITFKSSTPFFR